MEREPVRRPAKENTIHYFSLISPQINQHLSFSTLTLNSLAKGFTLLHTTIVVSSIGFVFFVSIATFTRLTVGVKLVSLLRLLAELAQLLFLHYGGHYDDRSPTPVGLRHSTP